MLVTPWGCLRAFQECFFLEDTLVGVAIPPFKYGTGDEIGLDELVCIQAML